jgi:hypothetical protein
MKSPDELGQVDWQSFEDGDWIPPLIRMLYDTLVPFDGNDADEHANLIYNVGVIYPVTVPAVPFLVHAARYGKQRRDYVGDLLARLTTLTDRDELGMSVRAAVAADALNLLPLLVDPDPDLRRQCLRALSGLGTLLDDEPAVLAAILDSFEHESDRIMRIEALTALELLEDPGDFTARIEQAASSADPVTRLAGALCAVEVGYLTDTDRWVGFGDDAELTSEGIDGYTPFPLGTMDQRMDRAEERYPRLWS